MDKLDRRKHGCDSCYRQTPTERFDGYRGNTLWICGDCYKIISKGIKKKNNNIPVPVDDILNKD